MEWIIPGIGGLLGLLGIGKLVELAYKAAIDRRAVKDTLERVTTEASINADVTAFKAINERLRIVEDKLDNAIEALTAQKLKNADAKYENIAFRKENERLEEELKLQRERTYELGKEVSDLKALIYESNQALQRRDAEYREIRGLLNDANKDLADFKKQMNVNPGPATSADANDLALPEVVKVQIVDGDENQTQ